MSVKISSFINNLNYILICQDEDTIHREETYTISENNAWKFDGSPDSAKGD